MEFFSAWLPESVFSQAVDAVSPLFKAVGRQVIRPVTVVADAPPALTGSADFRLSADIADQLKSILGRLGFRIEHCKIEHLYSGKAYEYSEIRNGALRRPLLHLQNNQWSSHSEQEAALNDVLWVGALFAKEFPRGATLVIMCDQIDPRVHGSITEMWSRQGLNYLHRIPDHFKALNGLSLDVQQGYLVDVLQLVQPARHSAPRNQLQYSQDQNKLAKILAELEPFQSDGERGWRDLTDIDELGDLLIGVSFSGARFAVAKDVIRALRHSEVIDGQRTVNALRFLLEAKVQNAPGINVDNELLIREYIDNYLL